MVRNPVLIPVRNTVNNIEMILKTRKMIGNNRRRRPRERSKRITLTTNLRILNLNQKLRKNYWLHLTLSMLLRSFYMLSFNHFMVTTKCAEKMDITSKEKRPLRMRSSSWSPCQTMNSILIMKWRITSKRLKSLVMTHG